MGGDRDVHDPPALVGEDHRHEQQSPRGRRHDEEIGCPYRSRSGMLSTDSMALITAWCWGRGATEALVQRGASPSVFDVAEHATAVPSAAAVLQKRRALEPSLRRYAAARS